MCTLIPASRTHIRRKNSNSKKVPISTNKDAMKTVYVLHSRFYINEATQIEHPHARIWRRRHFPRPELNPLLHCLQKYFFREASQAKTMRQDRAVGRGVCTLLHACACPRPSAGVISSDSSAAWARLLAGVRIRLKEDILLMGRMGRGSEKHGLGHPCPYALQIWQI
jgi:hypothetical protein